MRRRYLLSILCTWILGVLVVKATITPDTIRELRRLTAQQAEAMAYSNSPVACPEIILPSITGSKSSFRYIDAGCQTSLTIKPSFGVSGGKITGYNVYSIPYAPPFGFNEGTKIFIDKDDIWGDVINLPFDFCFYGNTYNKAVVAANGIVSFNTSVAGKPSGFALTAYPDIPNRQFVGEGGLNWANAIYGVFEDIDPQKITSVGTNGSIRYGILGTYPCRTLTISWYKVPNYDCTNSTYWETYQIVMYEGTNVIDVYVNHRARCSSWNYGRGIIGIQNATGTQGIAAPGRNTTDMWAAEKEAWRFAPICQPQYTITYYEGKGINGRVLGTGEQITINPQEISAITARLQFTAGNGDSFDLRDTAVIVYTQPRTEITNKAICEGQSYSWHEELYTQPGTYTYEVKGCNGCAERRYILNLSVEGGVHPIEYATICQGESFVWHGKTYTETGIYYDQQRTANGCEDVYTLNLTVNPSYQFTTKAVICYGETYAWRGKQYTTGGNYFDKYKTALGCDSIYSLQLVENPTYFFPQRITLCEGESYQWRGNSYFEGGVYYDSLIASCGCDSIYQLTITICPKYKYEEIDTICDGETYLWHGETLSKPGTYYHYYKSIYGCDSIYQLTLCTSPTYHFITEAAIKSGQTYTWRGNQYTKSGIYYDKYISSLGCDSIYQLNLQVYKAYFYPKQATICEGESYTYRGKTFFTDTVYGDTLMSRFGTDSIYQLTLQVKPPFRSVENVSICQGEEYYWHNAIYKETGVYLDEHESQYRCDSTYELRLTVSPVYHYITEDILCQNKSYEWHGFQYTKPGIYFDSYKTISGCDSIYELRLRLGETYYHEKKAIICEGDSYTWRNKSYTTTGTYYDSLTSTTGCDSVFALVLYVGGAPLIHQTDSFCQGDTYYWRGKSFKNEGVYYDSLITTTGCDSVYQLTLWQKNMYKFTTTISICEGESYQWRGAEYSQTDVYQDRYISSIGCDSIYELVLTVHPKFYYEDIGYICDGNSYYWHGKEYNQIGVYYDSLKTINGCDSVWQLTVKEAPNYYYSEDYVLCDGVSYTWHGKTYTKAGIYYDSLTTMMGCDSIFQLNLTVLPTYWFVEDVSICLGDTFPWRDSVYATEGIHYDWLATELGCDSVYMLNLTVNPTYNIKDTISLCDGDSYIWHEHVYSQPGLYYDSLSTHTSCDSVHSLLIIGHPIYRTIDSATICNGEIYMWRGYLYDSTGIYYDSLTTMMGCDSIFQLNLTVNNTYLYQKADTICQGDTYYWRGKSFKNEGVYYDSLITTTGCDSVFQLRLCVAPTYFMSNHYNICVGDTLLWHNQLITTKGTYTDSLITYWKCDSIYQLIVDTSSAFLFFDSATICQGDEYEFHGQIIDKAGKYQARYKTYDGCDSIYNINLSVKEFPIPHLPINDICADDEAIYIYTDSMSTDHIIYEIKFNELAHENGLRDTIGELVDGVVSVLLPPYTPISYINPNEYTGTIILRSESCNNDHAYDFSVNILYPASVLVQKFDDVLAVQNEKYNGGYTFSSFQWYMNEEKIENADGSYYYSPPKLEDAFYQVLLTRATDGVSMLTCPIYPQFKQVVTQQSIKVYPTIINHLYPMIQIDDVLPPWRATLYDSKGQLLSIYEGDKKDTNILTIPNKIGLYILHVVNSNGDVQSVKMLIY